MIKTAVLIGHTETSPGACSPFMKDCEFQFNKKIALMAAERDSNITVFENGTYKNGYFEMVKNTSARINKGGFDLIIELHYNAADPSAHGSEALYYFKNAKGKKLANHFSSLMQSEMKYKSRGAKPLINKTDRGFWAVYIPAPTVVILEPFFGSNENDVKLMDQHKYVEVILKCIKYYEGLL